MCSICSERGRYVHSLNYTVALEGTIWIGGKCDSCRFLPGFEMSHFTALVVLDFCSTYIKMFAICLVVVVYSSSPGNDWLFE